MTTRPIAFLYSDGRVEIRQLVDTPRMLEVPERQDMEIVESFATFRDSEAHSMFRSHAFERVAVETRCHHRGYIYVEVI